MTHLKMVCLVISFSLFSLFNFERSATAAIELQPHQKSSVDYLLSHPEQKGLLLFHSLGSGKTYISLKYTEAFPAKKVVILLPHFLKANWVTQMKSFGVTQTSRYEMVSLDESEKLLKYDLSNTIVVVDEVHKLIQKIRLTSDRTSDTYIRVYEKLKTAHKLLLLTGTPIFVDTSDISFIANLFDENDRYPTDATKFRTQYMKIKPLTSLARGHVTESKLMTLAIPFIATLTAVVTLGTSLPWAIPLVSLAGSAVLPVANEIFPAGQVAFREFDAEKWKEFSGKYVSYFNVKLAENKEYPGKEIKEKKVLYNDQQTDFFLSFIDEDLNQDQLRIMLGEESRNYSSTVLKIHSTRLQRQLLASPWSGCEIGNLDFKAADGTLIEPPKFLRILDMIRSQPGQVVAYSSYWTNGIQRFAAFLDRHGLKDQYVMVTPDQTVEEQTAALEKYNKTEKRILLIHPEITEGISLVGTEQFHILEPIANMALLDQIIGRATRFRSHTHLPPDRQKVTAYLWETALDDAILGLPSATGFIRREHWQKKYSEVSPSMWSKGIIEIDGNYFLKDETPDGRLKRRNSAILRDIENLRSMMDEISVERANRL